MTDGNHPILAYDRRGPSLELRDPEIASFLAAIYRDERYLEEVSESALKSRLRGLVRLLSRQRFGPSLNS